MQGEIRWLWVKRGLTGALRADSIGVAGVSRLFLSAEDGRAGALGAVPAGLPLLFPDAGVVSCAAWHGACATGGAAIGYDQAMQTEWWEWLLLALGASMIGLSKTGIAGIGILVVVIFASVLPPKTSVGVVLPILLSADVVAVTAFRRHAEWPHLWRLFPWAGAGIVAGYFAFGRLDDAQVEKLIGGIVLAMIFIHLLRQRRETAKQRQAALDDQDEMATPPASLWFVASMGLLAGFTTMVANAAGPVMILYLLAMRLPKMAFIGTSAWYFLILNLFKVPFSYDLGLIQPASLGLVATLAPFAVAGALLGRIVLRHIDQKTFEIIALALTVIAGLRLLL